MATKKVVFIAFAIEDENQRNLFTGQRLHPRNPYEFTDMSVKEPYSKEWKERVRTRIKRSDGVVVLVSKNSTSSDPTRLSKPQAIGDFGLRGSVRPY